MKVIINGGSPLNDCPVSWDDAKKWQNNANIDSDSDRPEWSWDCGFKLDYDGPILRISSRFYPPKTYYGQSWDGTVSIYIFDKKVKEQKFDQPTLNELRKHVEQYVYNLRLFIEQLFKE